MLQIKFLQKLGLFGLVSFGVVATAFVSQAVAYSPDDLNQLLETGNCIGCDLGRGEFFDNLELNNLDLSGADLTGADLTGAIFNNINFNGANFSNTQLNDTIFNTVDLRNSIFNTGGSFTQFVNIDLQDSSSFANGAFSYLVLGSSNFRNADLSNFSFGEGVLSNNDFRGANLTDLYLSGGALFSENNDFSGANLTSASFQVASSDNDNFSGADLTNTGFSGGFSNPNLSNTNLTNARFSGDFVNANFRNANLTNADFSEVYDLSNADFTGASNLDTDSLFASSFFQNSPYFPPSDFGGITLPDGSNIDFCSGTEVLTDSSGSFSSQSGFDFVRSNSNCSFLIQAAADEQITLDFTTFDLGDDGTLSIFDGENDSATLLASFTGTEFTPVTSSGNSLFINFSNGFTPETPGFVATYSISSIDGGGVDTPVEPNLEPTTTPEPNSLVTLLAFGSLGIVTIYTRQKK